MPKSKKPQSDDDAVFIDQLAQLLAKLSPKARAAVIRKAKALVRQAARERRKAGRNE